jgi:hypothetical protein
MKGVEFTENVKGEKVAVVINLQKHGKIWEDFYDSLIARSREKEPRISMETVKKTLICKGKLSG